MDDRTHVLAGGSWTFDDDLIVLVEPSGKGDIENMNFSRSEFWVQIHCMPLLCMTTKIGWFLGNLVRDVSDVDVDINGDCSGKFLRLRVKIDVERPLWHFLQVDVMGDGEETVMLLRYEQLTNHCFHYERIGHSI